MLGAGAKSKGAWCGTRFQYTNSCAGRRGRGAALPWYMVASSDAMGRRTLRCEDSKHCWDAVNDTFSSVRCLVF